MIEILITLCVKAMVGAVKAEISKIPLKVAEQIAAGWDGEEKTQLSKVWNWVRFAEDAADARAAVVAALDSWKSKGGGDWTWDTLGLVSAVGATGKSLSNIVNGAKLVESRGRRDRVQRTRYAIVKPEPTLSVPRRPARKRPVRRQKRVSNETYPQITVVRLRKF